MKRVIFLDVDGVLNCHQTFLTATVRTIKIDRERVQMVADLARRTGAVVVISSTWRKGRGAMTRLRGWLADRGLPSRLVIGHTPDLSSSSESCRGDEIAAWLALHHGVESFVILDDDADMGTLMDRLVQTTFQTGLTTEHCKKAEECLTR